METSVSLPEAAHSNRRGVALALLISLFFLWGVANNLNDILIRQFKKAFELTDFQSGLVQSAFYLGYFLFALPAALFLRWRGYKAGIVLGLSLYAAGAFLFYPAAMARGYGFFLLALFVIASGLSFLETSANPFVTLLGPAEGAERRLNFAQAFNPLGSITGVLIGRLFIFSGNEYTPEQLAAMPTAARDAYYAAESVAVQQPYLIIGVIVALLALIIRLTPFPAGRAAARAGVNLSGGLRALVGNPRFGVAVLAQFFYVGAQVGIWSYLIRYAQGTLPGTPEKTAADYLILSLVVFMIGRFAGTALMKGVRPVTLLGGYALTNALLAAIAMLFPGYIGLYALIATSFFMSIMFPTIFAIGLRNVAEGARELASSFLVMAIIGGAVLTPAMGAISGQVGIQWSMVVPLIAFGVVLVFALCNRSATES